MLVNDWLDCAIEDLNHLGRQLLKELICELPLCGAPVTYRARGFPENEVPTDPLQFGPNPAYTAGRYNRGGQPALYLGSELYGVALEMAPHFRIGRNFYVARYAPLEAIGLVDLSARGIHPALHHAFDRAERLASSNEAAQRIAELVRELGIDGFIVPGVRGNVTARYTNVVVFRNQDWDQWVDVTYLPTKLAEIQ